MRRDDVVTSIVIPDLIRDPRFTLLAAGHAEIPACTEITSAATVIPDLIRDPRSRW